MFSAINISPLAKHAFSDQLGYNLIRITQLWQQFELLSFDCFVFFFSETDLRILY